MTAFSYRLVCLTHGDSKTLPEAVGAFIAHADPLPRETVIVVDGPAGAAVSDVEAVLDRARLTVRVEPDTAQRGFCAATHRAWRLASQPGTEHVVWLEHDFLLERETDWEKIAATLDANTHLAQMALMRDAVNQDEKAAGGLFEYRRDQYVPCGPHAWQHRAYFTTNVSIMRREFMVENPWPYPDLVPDRCEGIYGIGLVEDNWWFGVYGDGTPWTTHIGVRDGSGFAY